MSKQSSLVSVETIEKWFALAQRRCAYFEELHQSGRWQRIYPDQLALQTRMQKAVLDVVQWSTVLERAMNAQPIDDGRVPPNDLSLPPCDSAQPPGINAI